MGLRSLATMTTLTEPYWSRSLTSRTNTQFNLHILMILISSAPILQLADADLTSNWVFARFEFATIQHDRSID